MPDKLITRKLDATPAPATGAKTLWDAEVKGFGVRIYAPTKQHKRGARAFFFNYRIDGIERRYTIGDRSAWSLEAARAAARELRRRVDRGEDPVADKRERREAPTVKDLIERYVADHLPNKAGKGTTRHNDEKKMLAEIGGALGYTRKVADIHFGDIEAMHKEITASGRPVRANRILSICSKMFSLTLKPCAGETAPWRDAAQGNPCRGVARNHEEAKERFLSTAELAALSDALNASDAPGSAADCIKLIMLTGARPHEAMTARFEQFDAEPGFWVKSSAHTKQRKVHKTPLNPAALELLAELRAKRDRDTRKDKVKRPWVFPGQNRPNAPLKQIHSVWYAARDRATVALWASSDNKDIAGIVADLRAAGRDPTVAECRTEAARRDVDLPVGLMDARPYDLRHTFASVGAGGGLSLQIIGRLLGHTQSRTTQRYAHLADDPLREATDKIGSVIAGAGKGSKNVKRLRGTR
jgi:integrase